MPKPPIPSKPKLGLMDLDTVPEVRYAEGVRRPYLLTQVPEYVTKARSVSAKEYIVLGLLALAGFALRLHNLAQPNLVVFDEVHFGGFARKYILGTFFMDVHPPLAKMLFAAVGSFAGFNGEFEFKNIGDEFPLDVPYVFMRAFPAALGVATVLLFYLTLRNLGVRPAVALLTALCFIVENSFLTISRFVLLDAPLLFFIAAAIYSFKRFETQQPFLWQWWRLLVACAVALGLAVLLKWVGLFTIAWAGIGCAMHMWFLIGDLRVPAGAVWRHAGARALLLLGIPALLYVLSFAVHFLVLTNDGDGGAFMTLAFRAGLAGSQVPRETTARVGYGSVVTLRHVHTRGGYLHLHQHFYPTGSKQQQITLYPHLDANNDWIIEPYNESTPAEFVPLKNGAKIRLLHAATGRRLHSHDEKPPVLERDWQKECLAYGYEGFAGDANDDWEVEVVEHRTPKHAQDEVRAIETVFRLRHAMTGNYLFSLEVKLPDWGFEQQEVTAALQGFRPLTHWYVETNTNERLPDPELVRYPALGLWRKIKELHFTMWKINLGLTAHHNWQLEPQEWPLLLRGINYWVKHHTQVYLLGNPLLWLTALALVAAFIVHTLVLVVRWQVGGTVARNKFVFFFNYHTFLYVAGWATHYLPFFIMGRQLFLHHYLPAQYFALLALGQFFDLVVAVSRRYSRVVYGVLVAYLVASVYVFSLFSPLAYGSEWTKGQCNSLKLYSSWDFDCNAFFELRSEYELYTPTVAEQPSETAEAESEEAQETRWAPPPPEVHLDNEVVVENAVVEEAVVEDAVLVDGPLLSNAPVPA